MTGILTYLPLFSSQANSSLAVFLFLNSSLVFFLVLFPGVKTFVEIEVKP